MREAVTRSMTSVAARPCVCWSVATSRSSGNRLQLVDKFRGPQIQFIRVRIFQRVLELRAADAVFDRQVLHRLHVQRDAIDFFEFRLQAGGSRREALILRCSSGLRSIRMRPLFRVVLVPSTPMKEERFSTAGSFRITWASCRCRAAMAGNEMDCGACEIP